MRKSDNDQLLLQVRALQQGATRIRAQIKTLNGTVGGLQVAAAQVPAVAQPMINSIRDSDWDFSKLAYTGAGANTDSAHFYAHFQLRVTSGSVAAGTTLTIGSPLFTTAVFALGTIRAVILGALASGNTLSVTLTRLSDTTATMSTTSDVTAAGLEVWFGLELNEAHANGAGTVTALETTATSGAAWDKTTSTALIGGDTDFKNKSIDQPLLGNPCAPSLPQYFQVIARLIDGAGAKATGLSFYVGVWDATSGQQKWLEGTAFTLSADKVGPHTGGATTRTYRIIATTDWGYQLQSTDAVVSATIDPLDSGNYVSLEWDDLVGINKYQIFEYDGSSYSLIFEIDNGDFTYFVAGPGERLDTGWPTITQTKWRALVVLPTSQFSPVEGAWKIIRATLRVPNTYNMQNTTGKQWLRMGLTSTTPDLSVRLDHAGLSTAPGTAWAKSSVDATAVSLPDGNGSSGDQGSTGGTGGPIFPNGQGGTICVFEDTFIWTTGRKLRAKAKSLVGKQCDDGYGNIGTIVDVNYFDASSTVILTTANGAELRCSLRHPIIRSKDDMRGTPANKLKVGDRVITNDGKTSRLSRLIRIESGGPGRVVEISLAKDSAPRYLAGVGKVAICQHNTKIQGVQNPF